MTDYSPNANMFLSILLITHQQMTVNNPLCYNTIIVPNTLVFYELSDSDFN